MVARFNHIIIPAHEAEESANFYRDLLEAARAPAWGPFAHVLLSDGVLLQFARPPEASNAMHFAFLVDDAHFDRTLEALTVASSDYWADPQRTRRAEVGSEGTARVLYLLDPFGHLVEILTQTYIEPLRSNLWL